MMTNQTIHCPVCNQTNQIVLIEELYFALIEKDQAFFSQHGIDSFQSKSIFRKISPPSLERLPIWLILSPDILIGSILGILLVFSLFSLNQNMQEVRNLFFLIIVILIGYVALRKPLFARFQANKADRELELQKAQKTAERWSSYFICLRDQTVFSGHSGNHFSIEEFKNKIHTDENKTDFRK
jgi:hypothetical protein